jgi:hypothetical protein
MTHYPNSHKLASGRRLSEDSNLDRNSYKSSPIPEFIEGRDAGRARILVRKPQIDQSAARSSMWSMRPRAVSSATTCAAACAAVCLSSPTISSGASGGS